MSSMLDHWIRFLPEAGTITDFAGEIEMLESDIKDTAAKLQRLKTTLKRKEKEAYTRAYKGGWTDADIIEAKGAQIASWSQKT